MAQGARARRRRARGGLVAGGRLSSRRRPRAHAQAAHARKGDRGLRQQRSPRHRRVARRRRAGPAGAEVALGDRLRRHRDGRLHLPRPHHGGLSDPRDRRDRGHGADRSHRRTQDRGVRNRGRPRDHPARVHWPGTPGMSARAGTGEVAVLMSGIHKRFGPVRANEAVNLSVAAGTVHALVGENGAGKSTLMSVLYGLYTPDSGAIEVFRRRPSLRSTHDAIALGLGMVHQHFMLVDTLTALENVMLGAEPHALLRRAEAIVRPRLSSLMASTGLAVDLDARAGDLPVGDPQRLEILKVLYRGARVLILDEPTAVLTPHETVQLFDVLARLRGQGTTVILITHKLDEVMRLADRVTVMRGGHVVHECAIAETNPAQLAEAMVGRKVNIGRPADAGVSVGEIVLDARGLHVRDAMGVIRLHAVDLALRAGQIVGVAGVSGNGQTELLEVLSGLRVPQGGTLTLAGETFSSTRWLTP